MPLKVDGITWGRYTQYLTNRMDTLLNGVCPYYTMFPLAFPLRILPKSERPGDWVLDPFCGRGTTSFAARLRGIGSVGIDSSPVAVALAKAKLAKAGPADVVMAAYDSLQQVKHPKAVPSGEFWRMAFHPTTLHELCRLRESLLVNCTTDAQLLLRVIVLGALHGPLAKGDPTYFSNQCPRTFAPKPDYAVRYWRRENFKAPEVNLFGLVIRRAVHYLLRQPDRGRGFVLHGDSREVGTYAKFPAFSWVVTSPPYYGMRTYVQDQWIRNWFLGGPAEIDYRQSGKEFSHRSPKAFIDQLAKVWRNVASVCKDGARLVTRFGGIHDREAEPMDLIAQSLKLAGWKVLTTHSAGTALDGKRQASQFKRVKKAPKLEYDIYARLA